MLHLHPSVLTYSSAHGQGSSEAGLGRLSTACTDPEGRTLHTRTLPARAHPTPHSDSKPHRDRSVSVPTQKPPYWRRENTEPNLPVLSPGGGGQNTNNYTYNGRKWYFQKRDIARER